MAPPRRTAPRPWRDKRGVAALEMAAVAPFLLLLIVVAIDFGRATSQRIELSHAVRAGAQYAVTAANAQRRIETAVRDALPTNLKTATIATSCHCGALPGGTALPPVAACDDACPEGSARLMRIRASVPFTPVNMIYTPALRTAFNFNTVAADVTIRHQ